MRRTANKLTIRPFRGSFTQSTLQKFE